MGAPLVFNSGMRKVVIRDPYAGRLTYDFVPPGSRSTGPAYLDARRRPMQWPRVLTGHVPSVPGSGSPDVAWSWSPLAPFNQWTPVSPPNGGVYLDLLFDGQPRMKPQ